MSQKIRLIILENVKVIFIWQLFSLKMITTQTSR